MDFDANTIAQLRRQRGWSQSDLADAVGVSRGTISNTEAGASIPRSDLLGRIAAAFGETVDAFFVHASEAATAVDGASKKITHGASTAKQDPVGNPTGA